VERGYPEERAHLQHAQPVWITLHKQRQDEGIDVSNRARLDKIPRQRREESAYGVLVFLEPSLVAQDLCGPPATGSSHHASP
jgi:hypothetical protein